MAPLHTVNKSPYASDALASCLDHLVEGAAVLLMEDGVYAAMAGGGHATRLAAVATKHRLYVLAPDLAARGLDRTVLVAGIEVIDYLRFVDLAAEHSAVQAWL